MTRHRRWRAFSGADPAVSVVEDWIRGALGCGPLGEGKSGIVEVDGSGERFGRVVAINVCLEARVGSKDEVAWGCVWQPE